jgi:uncharacterized membrane protein
MPLRSARERIYQTLAFESGGLVMATPLYGLVFDQSTHQSLTVLVSLSLAVMLWTPLHNTLFDIADLHLSGRVASARPHRLRLFQALSQEVSALVVTLPLIMILGGHGLGEALMLDFGLTLFYAAYAYLFHILYDWLRPVTPRSFPAGAAQEWSATR